MARWWSPRHPRVSLEAPRSVVWVDRNGHESASGVPDRPYLDVKISPDEKRLALTVLEKGERHLSIWDLERQASTRTAVRTGRYVRASALDGNWRRDRLSSGTRGRRPQHLADGRERHRESGAADDQHQSATGHQPHVRSSRRVSRGHGPYEPRHPGPGARWRAQITPLAAFQDWETNGVVSPDGRWLAYECCNVSSRRDSRQPLSECGGGTLAGFHCRREKAHVVAGRQRTVFRGI